MARTARLFAILARDAPRAVVFRRGPSKQVLLVHWRTDTDEFEEGQWLKGRIYERRCDLSPDGSLLVYFAATHKSRMLILGIAERGESWYVIEHELVDKTSGSVRSLGRGDWADWDHSGDLLFAKEGKIFRLVGNEPRQIADLSELTFEPREPTASAKMWPEPLAK